MKVNDLLLILDKDPKSLSVLRTVAERLGCDHVEADSADGLKDILSGRRPTIAVLAVDGFDVPRGDSQPRTGFPEASARSLVHRAMFRRSSSSDRSAGITSMA